MDERRRREKATDPETVPGWLLGVGSALLLGCGQCYLSSLIRGFPFSFSVKGVGHFLLLLLVFSGIDSRTIAA